MWRETAEGGGGREGGLKKHVDEHIHSSWHTNKKQEPTLQQRKPTSKNPPQIPHIPSRSKSMQQTLRNNSNMGPGPMHCGKAMNLGRPISGPRVQPAFRNSGGDHTQLLGCSDHGMYGRVSVLIGTCLSQLKGKRVMYISIR